MKKVSQIVVAIGLLYGYGMGIWTGHSIWSDPQPEQTVTLEQLQLDSDAMMKTTDSLLQIMDTLVNNYACPDTVYDTIVRFQHPGKIKLWQIIQATNQDSVIFKALQEVLCDERN